MILLIWVLVGFRVLLFVLLVFRLVYCVVLVMGCLGPSCLVLCRVLFVMIDCFVVYGVLCWFWFACDSLVDWFGLALLACVFRCAVITDWFA